MGGQGALLITVSSGGKQMEAPSGCRGRECVANWTLVLKGFRLEVTYHLYSHSTGQSKFHGHGKAGGGGYIEGQGQCDPTTEYI